ncbi:MAG: AAA family ATPase [Candidatus Altiarchaeota archaeon]|nr:AAA family ATPase [Candidatus Altiarchaeota archaeon]
MWTEKYKPKKLEELVGNRGEIEKLEGFNWKKPLLVHGATGIGKTALVGAIANDMDFDIAEINSENIGQAASISSTGSLFGRKRLVVIENAESIRDMKALSAFLESVRTPTLLTTSEYDSKRLKTVKKLCIGMQLKRPMAATIANYLAVICKKEEVTAEKSVLTAVAENSNGDIRVALTDLEMLAKGKREITEKDAELLYSRDVKEDIYKALNAVFSESSAQKAVESTRDLSENPEIVVLWIAENASGALQGARPLSDAFYYLSRASVFLGRVHMRQYWGFWRYAGMLMTAGITVSKESVKHGFYRFPGGGYFATAESSLGRTKLEREAVKEFCGKLKARIHASNRVLIREDVPLLRTLLKHNKTDADEIKKEYMMTDEELAYITES